MTSAPLPTIPSGSKPSTSLISSATSVTLSDELPPVTRSIPRAPAPITPSPIPIAPETTPSTSSLGIDPSKSCSRLRPVFSSSSPMPGTPANGSAALGTPANGSAALGTPANGSGFLVVGSSAIRSLPPLQDNRF